MEKPSFNFRKTKQDLEDAIKQGTTGVESGLLKNGEQVKSVIDILGYDSARS